jgi:hypothetical protein
MKYFILFFAFFCTCSKNNKNPQDIPDVSYMDGSDCMETNEQIEPEDNGSDSEAVNDVQKEILQEEADQFDIEEIFTGIPFSEGPYGTEPWSTAGDFTVPTIDGDWNFKKNWSGGADSYMFVAYAKDFKYTQEIWSSSPKYLLKLSPPDVHLFFMCYDSNAEEMVKTMKSGIDKALDELGDDFKSQWKDRIHYVTAPPQDKDDWLGQMVKKHGYFAFAIDRLQRLREAGMLSGIGTAAELQYLVYEARLFNFEFEREGGLQDEKNVKIISLFSGDMFSGSRTVEVELPDENGLNEFDNMETDLFMGCKDMTDTNCGDWDYLANLYLCDIDNPEKCDTEIARWVTAYHRQGRWVTDITPAISLLGKGGKRKFRYDASGQTYVVDLKLRFSTTGKGMRPSEAMFLWSGGKFDLNYNPSKQPVKFTVPADVKKVDIFAIISGHGWGWDTANCAEFCNHTHHFSVNGKEHVKTHAQAGTQYGCANQVKDGVVPNQYGTWPLGRGGWCPGLDVKPFIADVSADLISGENEIAYKALFKDKEYDPKPVANPQGFPAEIRMSSYLVYWR